MDTELRLHLRRDLFHMYNVVKREYYFSFNPAVLSSKIRPTRFPATYLIKEMFTNGR